MSKFGQDGSITLAFLAILGAQCGEKNRSGYFNPIFSLAQMWAKWLHNHLPFWGFPLLKTKRNLQGPEAGQAGYRTPAFLRSSVLGTGRSASTAASPLPFGGAFLGGMAT